MSRHSLANTRARRIQPRTNNDLERISKLKTNRSEPKSPSRSPPIDSGSFYSPDTGTPPGSSSKKATPNLDLAHTSTTRQIVSVSLAPVILFRYITKKIFRQSNRPKYGLKIGVLRTASRRSFINHQMMNPLNPCTRRGKPLLELFPIVVDHVEHIVS